MYINEWLNLFCVVAIVAAAVTLRIIQLVTLPSPPPPPKQKGKIVQHWKITAYTYILWTNACLCLCVCQTLAGGGLGISETYNKRRGGGNEVGETDIRTLIVWMIARVWPGFPLTTPKNKKTTEQTNIYIVYKRKKQCLTSFNTQGCGVINVWKKDSYVKSFSFLFIMQKIKQILFQAVKSLTFTVLLALNIVVMKMKRKTPKGL